MTVYKYKVPIDDYPTIKLPTGAFVLHVAAQGDEPFIWALVNPDETRTETRKFRLAGTGHPLDEGFERAARYIGTVHLRNGSLVFHLFEV